MGRWRRGTVGWGVLSLAVAAAASPGPTPLARLDASDPAYTVYAAPRERSQYLLDHGYRLVYRESERPLRFQTEAAGTLGWSWREGDSEAGAVSGYHVPPVLRASYADCGRLDYAPFEDLEVVQRFAVHSSSFLVSELEVANRSGRPRELLLELRFELGQPLAALDVPRAKDQVFFRHQEPLERWSETRIQGFRPVFENLLLTRPQFSGVRLLDEQGRPLDEDALAAFRKRRRKKRNVPRGIALELPLALDSGRSVRVRFVRGIDQDSRILLWAEAEKLAATLDLEQLLAEAEDRLASAPPPPPEADRARRLVYWQALTLAQQMVLPPEGRTSHPYFVVSREPARARGHDGQSLPESLAMLSLARLDPAAAAEVQRTFLEGQGPDGYLYHRLGPYAARDYRTRGRPTTAAPLLSRVNWEVYRRGRDRKFLEQAYRAGSRFLRFLLLRRDTDGDGLLEWGGDSARESGRPASVVWTLAGRKRPDAGFVEALDLNCLVAAEAGALARMAAELGHDSEASEWSRLRERLAARINESMWDEASGFYYHVDGETNRFLTAAGADLRRQEVIGFLPLWAGIVPDERRGLLVRQLEDPSRFLAPEGVPTLARDDPAYDPRLPWRGAVSVSWSYLVFRGLLDGGRQSEAAELAGRVSGAAARQLAEHHLLTEWFGPSAEAPHVAAAVLAAMLLEAEEGP